MARWFLDREAQQGIPSVSLRRLLPEARFEGCQDLEVSGCTADSRRIDPGQVYVAVRGARHDGHAYVGLAIERGAAGVLVERSCPEAGKPQVVVPNTRVAFAKICQALAGDPSEHLQTVGIAGAVGCKLTSLFLRSIYEAAGSRYGWTGPSHWSDGTTVQSVGSAPLLGAEGLARRLAQMVEQGCKGGVIELGLEALQDRDVEGVVFDAAVVTSFGHLPTLSPEALQRQRANVARVFRQVAPGGATIVNADEPATEILGGVNLLARRVSFGIDQPADIQGEIKQLEPNRSRFVLRGFGEEASVTLQIGGRTAVSQALAAAALAWSQGIALDVVVAGLEGLVNVPGRLDPVSVKSGPGSTQAFHIWVDAARTPADLAEALISVRSFTQGRVHCVIGAEGLRDRSERLPLGRVAEMYAERVTLTSDNPRTEDPNQILDDLLAGLRNPGRIRVEPDRKLAIEATLADAQPGDSVLIAGKGSKAVQIFADQAVPFDDAAIARDWLLAREPNRSPLHFA